MKRLSVFLWLMVLAFAGYIISYAIFYNEHIRRQDLKTIEQQQNALQAVFQSQNNWVKKSFVFIRGLIDKHSNIQEDLVKWETARLFNKEIEISLKTIDIDTMLQATNTFSTIAQHILQHIEN